MGARLQNVVRDRAQHAAGRYTRDPIATCNTRRRAERLVLSAEDQSETIVAPTLLDGKRTDEFRRWTVTLGQPANGIGGI